MVAICVCVCVYLHCRQIIYMQPHRVNSAAVDSLVFFQVVLSIGLIKTTRPLSIFLRVTAAKNTGQNVSSLLRLVYNGDSKADRNGVRLPVSLHLPRSFGANAVNVYQGPIWPLMVLFMNKIRIWQSTFASNDALKQSTEFTKTWLTSSCIEACRCRLAVVVCSESSCCGPQISSRCGKRYRESRSYWPGGCWGVTPAWARRTSAARPSNSDGRRRRWCTPEGDGAQKISLVSRWQLTPMVTS